ncbi:MAG: corrinoid protein [Burkholderiaceae bacterium]|nr:corrinoid protein [Burkholderiaceae bacterium]
MGDPANHSPLYHAVLDYNGDLVKDLIEEALENGVDVQQILSKSLIPAMDEVGFRFASGSIFLPEMLMAANAMKQGLKILRPILVRSDRKSFLGRVVIGTVQGDLHDIGKNLVSMALEGAGFDVVDLGVDVNSDTFVQAVARHNPDIVALSALLTTTMGSMKGIIRKLKTASSEIRVIVGGAPVNADFATSVEADGFGADARDAVIIARQLIGIPATEPPGKAA